MLTKSCPIYKLTDFLTLLEATGERVYLRKKTSVKPAISIFNSIDEVAQDEWNAIVPKEKALMRLPYLRAIENSAQGGEQSRYVLIYKNEKPVAVAVFNIVLLTGEDYRLATSECSPMDRLKNSIKGKTKLRVLVCGHTHISGDHGFTYSDSISAEEAYSALSGACQEISKSEKSQGNIDLILIKDFYEGEFEASSSLVDFKYRNFQVDPNMILSVRPEWKEFDDYINAMSSKYRKKAVSTIKQGIALERRSLTAGEIEASFDKIQQLYANVTNKAKVRLNHFDTTYFIQLKLQLQDDFELIGYYLNGELVGFNTTIYWGNNCEAHAIGMDYDFNALYALYQNMLYDQVSSAISKKKSKLILGRTAMEMKSNFGAEPYEMCCYVRHSGPLINKALKPVFNYIKQTQWTQRRPFKELEITSVDNAGR
jgi:predicted N-acyltransferase